MLDTDTRRRIDTARDILVGKVPDPKSQVEQITIALIYKFMDDMDQESIAMGGKASFFTGEYARYAWSAIFNPRLGGFEMLALYGEAIAGLSLNPNLPQLFRDIFKNAYLPYRDPETLKLFLKTISEFSYDHSERLGDAFEYLLSVMSSQGDAGQFRTPRHIIDFMVNIIKPRKDETILDPACGTAGFLISAYKHILDHNRKTHPGDQLTPEERARLLTNFKGYDISPDMVRLSLVNLYLHGFVQPAIYEYDTLTSQDRWNDYADVILANPPFMTPKGGIKPHKRFSVQSNRSEVLFVDYMAEHLTPNGRAAIIVPEGIIFQSAGAYKQLRKFLVEKDYLWAVVSLPAGVFNPYSGVKTSILLLDRVLAKKTDQVLFVKIDSDGFDLGAQRRPLWTSDLPYATLALLEWQTYLRKDGSQPFDPANPPYQSLLVEKSRLAENGEYNLSSERYRKTNKTKSSNYRMEYLENICKRITETIDPQTFSGNVMYVGLENIESNTGCITGQIEANFESIKSAKSQFHKGDILYGKLRPNLNKVYLAQFPGICSTDIYVFRVNEDFNERFLCEILRSHQFNEKVLKGLGGAQLPRVSYEYLSRLQIPLPPLDVQRGIVAEIDACQRIIDGARQVVENWKPDIQAELRDALPEGMEEWGTVKLENVLSFVGSGVTPLGGKETYVGEGVLFIRSQNVLWGECDFSDAVYITEGVHREMSRSHVRKKDVLLNITGASIGRSSVYEEDREANVNQHVTILRCEDNLIPYFLMNYLIGKSGQDQIWSVQSGASRQALNYQQIRAMRIPFPPFEIQNKIVGKIERERKIIESNRELIRIYEAKIQKIIARVWEG